jgi:hypothetical protein
MVWQAIEGGKFVESVRLNLDGIEQIEGEKFVNLSRVNAAAE